MTGLTTHVLDLTLGKPAGELEISFYKTDSDRRELLARFNSLDFLRPHSITLGSRAIGG